MVNRGKLHVALLSACAAEDEEKVFANGVIQAVRRFSLRDRVVGRLAGWYDERMPCF